jgi:hypothetical protein
MNEGRNGHVVSFPQEQGIWELGSLAHRAVYRPGFMLLPHPPYPGINVQMRELISGTGHLDIQRWWSQCNACACSVHVIHGL